MHSPRQLNPSETAMFTADIARLPVEHQADVALTWRERCVAIMQEHMNPLADGLALLLLVHTRQEDGRAARCAVGPELLRVSFGRLLHHGIRRRAGICQCAGLRRYWRRHQR